MTVGEELARAEALARNTEASAWDARILLAHAVGHGKPLALDPREEIGPGAAHRFASLWERRVAGVPVQHLVGEWDFFGRPFFVDSRALVPRPETEILIETALTEAPGASRLLDLGTGCGVLAVTWLRERPDSRAVAVDLSTDALALTRANALRHGVRERLELVGSDWTSGLASGALFDVAVSNPPYLAHGEMGGLSTTVREHDPPAALYAGDDGLDAIRRLLDELPAFLSPGAPFLFEIGAGQAAAVERAVGACAEWRLSEVVPDLGRIPRVVVARRT